MTALLDMSLEFQLIAVAGFIAYQLSTIGRGIKSSTEQFLLQVLSFGLFARLISILVLMIIEASFDIDSSKFNSNDNISVKVLITGGATLFIALVAGMYWRKKGSAQVSRFMGWAEIYRDDHESSVYHSILNTKSTWSLLQITLNDGTVMESDVGLLMSYDEHLPIGPVLLDSDGIGAYLTGEYDAEGKYTAFTELKTSYGFQFTYFPMSDIKRFNVTWIKD